MAPLLAPNAQVRGTTVITAEAIATARSDLPSTNIKRPEATSEDARRAGVPCLPATVMLETKNLSPAVGGTVLVERCNKSAPISGTPAVVLPQSRRQPKSRLLCRQP